MNRQTVHHAQHRTKDDWSPSQTKDGIEARNVPQGRKPSVRYDAMGMMLTRIRTLSNANTEPNKLKQATFQNEDVFSQPHGSISASRAPQNIVNGAHTSRTSVIRRMENLDSQTVYQDKYSIPVYNSFDILGN